MTAESKWFRTLACVFLTLCANSCSSAKPQVLLVSFDGFRWDYLRMYNTSWFHYLLKNGASTTDGSIIGTFATNTFPSHVTLATGLFQESHGIVGNSMYDSKIGGSFFLSNKSAQKDPAWWSAATPIWITAEDAGKRAATYFWPGSEVAYDGKFQTIGIPYDQLIPFEQRVDSVVRWLKYGFVDLVTLYFHEPDSAGHKGGPKSPEVRRAVEHVNVILGRLITKLQSAKIFDSLNVIITSDHGMAAVNTSSSLIPLYTHVRNRTELFSEMPDRYGSMVGFFPKPGMQDELFRLLQNLTKTWPFSNMKVYRKQELPDRFHFKNNRRVPDIVVLANEGYYLLGWSANDNGPEIIGSHGYDNNFTSMRPIFIAHGPGFRAGSRVAPFRQVDVYNMMTHLLGIKGRPNNGSLENVKGLLYGVSKTNVIFPTSFLVLFCVGSHVFSY